MKVYLLLTVLLVGLLTGSNANAAGLDIGARFGGTVDDDLGTVELALRYFPNPLISLGGSLGYSDRRYEKDWYEKKSDIVQVGGFANAHLPVPFIKPYAGVGVLYYDVHNTSSTYPADSGSELTSSMTIQGGIDLTLPVPFLGLNFEVRRLLNDCQTQLFGGFWLRF